MPFQTVTNFQSKRKTDVMVAFNNGERSFGADAEALSARRPKSVFIAPQRLLGRNETHPNTIDYTQVMFASNEFSLNERGGYNFVVPEADGVVGDATESNSYSTEEIVSMLLAHARDFAQSFGGGSPVFDAIITVPSYATQNERVALLDAAELAGINVLALLDENTAAGIHYGLDRVTVNRTHRMLLYNMGHEATQATLFAYDSYNVTDKSSPGGSKAVGQARVVAKAWDTALGGRHFDRLLIDYFSEKFNAEKGSKVLPSSANGDIRNVPSAMAKMRKAISKAKEILSANEEYPLSMESLIGDVDFRVLLSRKILESEAKRVGLIDRIVTPIVSILEQSNLSLSDIDVIEIVGGGVRMPIVQSTLKAFLSPSKEGAVEVPLGVHLNGDEAMALGAAFAAANRSSSFRVRKVGMIDGYPWPIGARITHVVNESDAGVKAWSKRTSLFRPYNVLESVKRITINSDKDLRISLFYEGNGVNSTILPLPEGTNRMLAFYNVSGITEAAESGEQMVKEGKTILPGGPSVSITFELDQSGVARVSKAEATLTEEYLFTPTVKPSPSLKKLKKSSINATEGNNTQESNETSSSSESFESDQETEEHESVNNTALESEASQSPSPSPTPTLMKRTIRYPLTISLDTSTPSLMVRALSEVEKKVAIDRLKKLSAADELRRARERAKNALEAYIYATRGKLSDEEDMESTVQSSTKTSAKNDLFRVGNEAQISTIRESLTENEDWLYDEGTTADTETYKSKLVSLKGIVEPLWHRLRELRLRAEVISNANEFISVTRSTVVSFPKSHPQVSYQWYIQ
jgi:hypoxia up-regulated 1